MKTKIVTVVAVLVMLSAVAAADDHNAVEDFEILEEFDEQLAGGETTTAAVEFTSARDHRQPVVTTVEIESHDYNLSGQEFFSIGYIAAKDGWPLKEDYNESDLEEELEEIWRFIVDPESRGLGTSKVGLWWFLMQDGFDDIDPETMATEHRIPQMCLPLGPNNPTSLEYTCITFIDDAMLQEDALYITDRFDFPAQPAMQAGEDYEAGLFLQTHPALAPGEYSFNMDFSTEIGVGPVVEYGETEAVEFASETVDDAMDVRELVAVNAHLPDGEDVLVGGAEFWELRTEGATSMSIHYDEPEDVEDLALYRFNESEHAWDVIADADIENSVASADVSSTGLYAVFGETVEPEPPADTPSGVPAMRATEIDRTPDHVHYRLNHIRDRVELLMDIGASNIWLDEINMVPGDGVWRTFVTADVTDTVDDVPALADDRSGVEDLGYISVALNESFETESASFVFDADTPDDVESSQVQVYRWEDSAWTPVTTNHIEDDRFETEKEHFSTYAVGYQTADIRIVSSEVVETEDGAAFEVTLENVGDVDGEITLDMAAGDQTIQETVTVNAGDTVEERFEIELEPGTHEATINDLPVGEVQGAPDTPVDETPAEPDTPGPIGMVPGGTTTAAGAVIAILLFGGLYMLYRRRDDQ